MNFDNLMKLIRKMYSLQVLIRFNNCWRTINENVATHSYFVVLTTRFLYDYYSKKYYNLNFARMIDMSIIHDLPESDISDLPNDVKIKFSKLKFLLESLEIISIKENLKDKYYVDLYVEFIELKTIESKIVKLSDCISVQLYSEKEINLGNKNFNKILNRVNKEIKKIKNDITEIIKNKQ